MLKSFIILHFSRPIQRTWFGNKDGYQSVPPQFPKSSEAGTVSQGSLESGHWPKLLPPYLQPQDQDLCSQLHRGPRPPRVGAASGPPVATHIALPYPCTGQHSQIMQFQNPPVLCKTKSLPPGNTLENDIPHTSTAMLLSVHCLLFFFQRKYLSNSFLK